MNGIIKTLLFLWVLYNSIGIQANDASHKYRRCSLTQIMIEHPMYSMNEEIVQAYKQLPLDPRFSNHDLGVKVVRFSTQEYADQTNYINTFLDKEKVGNRSVAKWFSYNKADGSFNVSMVKERGFYNSNRLDYELSRKTVRGSAILEDAGENLIPDTYIIMHDICYKGKYSNRRKDFNRTGKHNSFSVLITSYIYSLNWSIEHLDDFYQKHYNSQNQNFIKEANYGYTYRAKVSTEYSESSSSISQKDLIKRVVGRALEINLVKLQTSYPKFRIKAPIISVAPLKADIGLKEGISESSRFEVLEPEQDTNGIIKYRRVGIIAPVQGKIADNRLMADNNNEYTEFRAISGSDFYEGLIIQEIK